MSHQIFPSAPANPPFTLLIHTASDYVPNEGIGIGVVQRIRHMNIDNESMGNEPDNANEFDNTNSFHSNNLNPNTPPPNALRPHGLPLDDPRILFPANRASDISPDPTTSTLSIPNLPPDTRHKHGLSQRGVALMPENSDEYAVLLALKQALVLALATVKKVEGSSKDGAQEPVGSSEESVGKQSESSGNQVRLTEVVVYSTSSRLARFANHRLRFGVHQAQRNAMVQDGALIKQTMRKVQRLSEAGIGLRIVTMARKKDPHMKEAVSLARLKRRQLCARAHRRQARAAKRSHDVSHNTKELPIRVRAKL